MGQAPSLPGGKKPEAPEKTGRERPCFVTPPAIEARRRDGGGERLTEHGAEAEGESSFRPGTWLRGFREARHEAAARIFFPAESMRLRWSRGYAEGAAWMAEGVARELKSGGRAGDGRGWRK